MSLYVQIQNQLPIRHNGHRIKRWSYNTLIKSQKMLMLALRFRGVSEWAKEPFWRAVTQNTNRNQRLGVKTLLPESIRNSKICFEKIMRCPLLSSWVFHYGNDSVSWWNERTAVSSDSALVLSVKPPYSATISHMYCLSKRHNTINCLYIFRSRVTFQLVLTGTEIFHHDDWFKPSLIPLDVNVNLKWLSYTPVYLMDYLFY